MAEAEARTTLFSSFFMSATVCRTVDSNVASSITSTPELAWPRAMRPIRLKKSAKNPILCSPLRPQFAEQAPRAQHIRQQAMHAGKDIVLVFRSHFLQFTEIVQRHGDFAAARFIQLKM